MATFLELALLLNPNFIFLGEISKFKLQYRRSLTFYNPQDSSLTLLIRGSQLYSGLSTVQVALNRIIMDIHGQGISKNYPKADASTLLQYALHSAREILSKSHRGCIYEAMVAF